MKKPANGAGVGKRSLWSVLWANRASYILVAPFMVIFFLFVVWPVILSFLLSFTSYNVLESPRFVGWNNYVRLFVSDDVFLKSVGNTFLLAVVTGPVSLLLSLLFAWIVNELPQKLRALMTLIFYAPSISGTMYTIWLIIFDGDVYGYLNSLLIHFGFIQDPIQWTKDPKYMMLVVVIVQLWVSLGTSFLTLRAGFSTVDRQYYEAGAVDGIRNRWQEFRYITFPLLTPHLMLSVILAITAAFGAEAVASTMTGFPSVNYATHTIMAHMKDYGTLRYERGYASAMVTLLFLVCIGVNRLAQKLLRKVGGD